MGSREDDVRRNTRTVRLDDLVAVLESAGFGCRRCGNGHWSCRHEPSGAWVVIAPAHGRGDSFLRPTYVRAALKALEAKRQWDAEQQP